MLPPFPRSHWGKEVAGADRQPKRGYSFSHSKQSSLEKRHEYCLSSFKETGPSLPARHFYSQTPKKWQAPGARLLFLSEGLAIVPSCDSSPHLVQALNKKSETLRTWGRNKAQRTHQSPGLKVNSLYPCET